MPTMGSAETISLPSGSCYANLSLPFRQSTLASTPLFYKRLEVALLSGQLVIVAKL